MQRPSALTRHHVRADALDRGAHRDEKAREVLYVWLAGGVAQHRDSLRGDRGRERILGAGHAWLVEKDVGAPELLRAHTVRFAQIELRTEGLQRQEVGVQSSSANHIATRRWQRHLAATREERGGE